MLHDPMWDMWLRLGWIQPSRFVLDLRKYGVVADPKDVRQAMAVIDGDTFRVLKRPLNSYGRFEREPTQVTYYRT